MREALGDALAQLLLVVAAARAEAAQRVGHARHDRVANLVRQRERLLERRDGAAARELDRNFGKLLVEDRAVLGRHDRVHGRAQDFHSKTI